LDEDKAFGYMNAVIARLCSTDEKEVISALLEKCKPE
jgi:hypothetical protein